jgi:hypothetical protein
MGKRDVRQRETKKPKKDTRKPIIAAIAPPTTPQQVEVVRKRRKSEGETTDGDRLRHHPTSSSPRTVAGPRRP